ncbi:uncharacterized protein LOC130742739 [Lotus japonicus]|uniref:uncharacterized protein LOC130742739 n=1 Tax=Lotus japonicus TaxID=34305 RepID=UPI0025847C53|nr:uncharacterized protein LOC130742739 [Lotus japonicus]XP_057450823.1 uncharacterized protein LOC130742739 [Lotus japonicus]
MTESFFFGESQLIHAAGLENDNPEEQPSLAEPPIISIDVSHLYHTDQDPTGAVDASIHRKAFTHSEFANDITVGSVLVLQKVAVFAPRGTVCYLNITLPNLVKVFPKDCGPHDFIDITEE